MRAQEAAVRVQSDSRKLVRACLNSKMEVEETQKRSLDNLKSLENRTEGHLWAQICFGEAIKDRKKELQGSESELREQKETKKVSREFQEAPKQLQSHDLMALLSDYEFPRCYRGHRPSFGGSSAPFRP